MIKRIALVMLAGLIALACCGCSLFQAEYRFSAPYSGDIGHVSGDATEISNYNMLKGALISMISRHEEQGEFRFSRYNGSVTDDLAAACYEIKNTNPVGAYAVEALSYDTSRIVSYYVADVLVTYKKTAEEINSIVGAASTAELNDRLKEMVFSYAPGMVLRIYSSAVDVNYLEKHIRDFFLEDPVSLPLAPEISIESYPNEGANRIYDIRMDYDRGANSLQTLAEILSAAVDAMTAKMTKTEKAPLALECAEMLSRRLENGRDFGTYESTAYGALVEQHADSKGAALAYKALCNALEIDCMVVEGSAGAMGTEKHYWNIIELYGDCYHVDVFRFGNAPAEAFLLDDGRAWGTYIWETSDYPECSGGLRYQDLIPPEEQKEEEDPPPEETAPPETPVEENEENSP